MVDSSKVFSHVWGSPHGNNNHDQSTSGQNNYIAILPRFSADSIEFERWKIKMYTHIIGMVDELWDVLEDGIDFHVNGVGVVSERNLSFLIRKIFIKSITKWEAFFFMLYLIMSI